MLIDLKILRSTRRRTEDVCWRWCHQKIQIRVHVHGLHRLYNYCKSCSNSNKKRIYWRCILPIFFLQVKTGHFSEHSNQLWNISGIPSWSKINDGFIKMYQGEVSEKTFFLERLSKMATSIFYNLVSRVYHTRILSLIRIVVYIIWRKNSTVPKITIICRLQRSHYQNDSHNF